MNRKEAQIEIIHILRKMKPVYKVKLTDAFDEVDKMLDRLEAKSKDNRDKL